MKINHFIFISSFICQFSIFQISAFANEGSDVIDLGQLSVTGEVRRPAINWIDSQKSVRESMPSLLKIEFDSYEEKLLEPAPIKKNESEKQNEQD